MTEILGLIYPSVLNELKNTESLVLVHNRPQPLSATKKLQYTHLLGVIYIVLTVGGEMIGESSQPSFNHASLGTPMSGTITLSETSSSLMC